MVVVVVALWQKYICWIVVIDGEKFLMWIGMNVCDKVLMLIGCGCVFGCNLNALIWNVRLWPFGNWMHEFWAWRHYMNIDDIFAMINVVCAYNYHELLYDMHHVAWCEHCRSLSGCKQWGFRVNQDSSTVDPERGYGCKRCYQRVFRS